MNSPSARRPITDVGRRGSGPTYVSFCACVVLAAMVHVVGAAAPPAAVRSSAGGVAGVVQNGTTNRPMAGVRLSLVRIGANGPEGTTRTDARGRFAFQGVTPGRYLVRVDHQGVEYGARADVGLGPPVELVVQVHDISNHVPLRIALLGIVTDVHQGYARVSEVVHLLNPTSSTFWGDVVIHLPGGATYITFETGWHEPRLQENRLIDRLIVRPGVLEVAYAYSVAGEGIVALDRPLLLPVDRVESFTSAPAEIRSPRLMPEAPADVDGRTYTRASGHDIPAGSFSITVAGVAASQHWPAPTAAGTLAAILTLGMILAWRRIDRANENPLH